jgi:xylitol oxidase
MVPEEFFGAGRFTGQVRLADAPADNLTPHGVAGPWSHRLPHFRIDSVPSNGNEIQSEYFVGAEHGPAALDAVRRLARQVAPLLLVCEIRAIAADGLWLSGAYDRETVAIHFTWRKLPQQVDAVLVRIEEALAPYDARPHWGKVSHVPPGELARRYPRLADARELFERLDPDGRFSGHRLERLGVREPR